MSYDLFFRAATPEAAVGRAEVMSYFQSRPRYEIAGDEAFYQNEDTGVYFSFEYTPPDDGDEAAGGEADDGGWSFNMNYVRPHVFGLEAEREVTAFVRLFGFEVSDPQRDGMGEGPYTPEGFLAGWNAGNRFGLGAILAQHALDASTGHVLLPSAEIERIWRWNVGREDLQKRFGDDVFVPRISVVRHGGEARTLAVWGDAIPVALPPVDLVALARQALAPRRFLSRKPDMALVSFADLGPVLSHARANTAPPAYHLFRHAEPPPAVAEFFRAQKPFAGQLDGVAFDQVLDAELVASVRAQRPGGQDR